MNREEFLTNLFSFFRVDVKNIDLLKTYDMALTEKYVIDWNAFYQYIIRTSEKRILPMPKFLIDLLPNFRIREYKTGDKDGEVIIVELLNGRKYIFEVNINSSNTLEDVINQFRYKDEEEKKTHIKSIKRYPKGTVMIGNEVFVDDEELGG